MESPTRPLRPQGRVSPGLGRTRGRRSYELLPGRSRRRGRGAGGAAGSGPWEQSGAGQRAAGPQESGPCPGPCPRLETAPSADLTKRPGTARRPEPRAPGGGSAPMGCMQSGRRARAAEPDGAEGPSGTADSALRPKCKQQLRIVDPTREVHSAESLNIRVIWRRVSIFGSRRDSVRSTRSRTSATTLPGASDSGPESGPKEAEAAGETPPA